MARCNGQQGQGPRLDPHIEPRGAYFLLALTTGKETEIEPQGVRIAPHPPSRARSGPAHT